MTPAEASRVLGLGPSAGWEQVRTAYRAQIRAHHPDRAGEASSARASRIIEAYTVLERARHAPSGGAPPPPPPPRSPEETATAEPDGPPVAIRRVDADTIALGLPADEAFRLLFDAAHDVGDVTYVDRSMPILEVLCRFEGEPATSLLVSLQGRNDGTDALCSVESIEDRPAPPAAAVVDLLELALHRRVSGPPPAR